MKPPRFTYERPATLQEAIGSLRDPARNAAAIAGGQTLITLLNLRLASPDALVDIRAIPELNAVREEADSVFIGAATTHSALEDGEVADPARGLMRLVAQGIAYRAIRHRGTLGGSVALADPAADWPGCLVALGASAVIAGPAGTRVERVSGLIRDTYTTSLGSGELIVGFEVPRLSDSGRWGHAKAARKSGAYAESIAVVVRDQARAVCSVVLTGADSRPKPMQNTASYVLGTKSVSLPDLQAAVQRDLHGSMSDADPYRTRCHIATVTRAVLQAEHRP
ncbi:MAG: FAD binding domain-containing protein [Burkholderiales bacterium]|nr:FAD binding domain-containing protein [Burkholderiales bacterium]